MASTSMNKNLIQRYKFLITDPKSFFKEVPNEPNYHQSLFFLVILTIFATLINIILTTPLLLKGTASFANISWSAQFLTLLYYPIYNLLYVVLASIIAFILLTLLKTKEHHFKSDLNILSYSQTIILLYSVLGTVIVLATELITNQSANQALLVVLNSGFPAVSKTMAISVIISLILTFVSWFHLLWATMLGFTSHYSLSKIQAILIPIVAFVISFIILTLGSGLITLNI